MEPSLKPVAIVGGGFAGVALAYHLLQDRSSRLQVTLVEPRAELGRGIAYGVRSPVPRLNVPASSMSIDPRHPDDFVQFARAGDRRHEFLPRQVYGDYVGHCLERACAENPGRLRVVRGAVAGLDDSRTALRLADGRRIHAERIVLATGLSARSNHCRLPRDARVLDAWDEHSLARLPPTGRILLLGSGLSALDVFGLLEAREHRGEVVLLSRHGLLPRPHAKRVGHFEAPAQLGPPPVRLRPLIAWVRQLLREATAAGACWQHALEALRPRTQQIWQSLPAADRAQFVRRVRTYWEVLRHRAPVDVLERLAARRVQGDLDVRAGRLVHCESTALGLRVVTRDRGHGALREETFSAVVCCIGPSSEIEDGPPLMAALLRDGLATVSSMRLGIETGAHGRVIDARGRPSEHVFALGQLCRASRWKTTSAPDIVRDAVALADVLQH